MNGFYKKYLTATRDNLLIKVPLYTPPVIGPAPHRKKTCPVIIHLAEFQAIKQNLPEEPSQGHCDKEEKGGRERES